MPYATLSIGNPTWLGTSGLQEIGIGDLDWAQLTSLSLDRTMPTNALYLDVLQDIYLFEFNEVNVLARRPSSEPLISCR